MSNADTTFSVEWSRGEPARLTIQGGTGEARLFLLSQSHVEQLADTFVKLALRMEADPVAANEKDPTGLSRLQPMEATHAAVLEDPVSKRVTVAFRTKIGWSGFHLARDYVSQLASSLAKLAQGETPVGRA
jgi:hypothetical protein